MKKPKKKTKVGPMGPTGPQGFAGKDLTERIEALEERVGQQEARLEAIRAATSGEELIGALKGIPRWRRLE